MAIENEQALRNRQQVMLRDDLTRLELRLLTGSIIADGEDPLRLMSTSDQYAQNYESFGVPSFADARIIFEKDAAEMRGYKVAVNPNGETTVLADVLDGIRDEMHEKDAQLRGKPRFKNHKSE